MKVVLARTVGCIGVVLASSLLFAGVVAAHGPDEAGVVQVAFDQPVTNIPGESLVALEVSYGPGAKDLSHRHADSAFIMAYVLSGAIRSQVAGQPPRVFKAGETWQEVPGDHHVVSENASATEPARLLAVFVVDSSQSQALTTFDADSGNR
ncbi:cupin domain-containing protein [Mycolicibacterium wolinskyi]|uniref:cupin domain-containing protein n=1 Tax=Mycolicibacterium wolinskyi TaxID=59750 RepID=UPI000AEF7A6C